jgi:hypothetical protein
VLERPRTCVNELDHPDDEVQLARQVDAARIPVQRGTRAGHEKIVLSASDAILTVAFSGVRAYSRR